MTTADPTAEDHDGVAPLVVDAFGVRVRVLPPDAAARERWTRQWSRALSDDASAADVTVDARSTTLDVNADTADYTLSSRVTLAALAHAEGSRLCLHAAGLSDAEGRVLALVAASGTGKTTAARTLGASLGYLSDETVSIGASGEVLAYPKPLSVVIDPARPYHKSQHSPDELGLLVPPERVRMQRLVLLHRDPDGAAVGLEPMAISEALPVLVAQSSYLITLRTPLLDLTRMLRAVGGPWLLRYAEIGDHVDELRALLAAPTSPVAPPEHYPGRSSEPKGSGAQLARAPWQDAVEFDDALVVLVDSSCFRLDHLAATVWLALDRVRPFDEVVRIAEKHHGPHPDAERLVADAVDVLVQNGMVRRLF